MDHDSVYPLRRVSLFGQTFTVTEEFTDIEVARFLNKVRFDVSGCWIWTAYLNPNGYSSTNFRGQTWAGHRLAYAMFVGPIPNGRHLHHRTEAPFHCMGPKCVNPAHLLPLTPRDHVIQYTPDAITSIRANATHCPRGHELSGDNLYIFPGTQKRRCRECNRIWARRAAALKAASQVKPLRTHCNNGHLLDAENSYEYLGLKYCRKCHAELTLRRYHEKRSAHPPTHCANGHLWSENQILKAKGGRTCRACIIAARAARTAKENAMRQVVEGVACCWSGHPMTPDNIGTSTNRGKPITYCLICHRQQGRAAYERRKAKYAKS